MLTKEMREEIVKDFERRHNGIFHLDTFIDEVLEVGEDHPAHGWFTTDRDQAFRKLLRQEARRFVSGIRVHFEILETGVRNLRIKTHAPAFFSPVSLRKDGGGYIAFRADDSEHQAELVLQAESALSAWVTRYQAAMSGAGLDDELESVRAELIPRLRSAWSPTDEVVNRAA